MKIPALQVSTSEELLAAAADPKVAHIQLAAALQGVPTLRLSPGQALSGAGPQAAIRFAAGQDGLRLCADNQVENLALAADPERRAVFNDTSVEQLGRLTLCGLAVTGVVQLLARDRVRGGHVEAHDIDIAAACSPSTAPSWTACATSVR